MIVRLLAVAAVAAGISVPLGSHAQHRKLCRWGASSIGPVMIRHGHVVGGSDVAHFTGCR